MILTVDIGNSNICLGFHENFDPTPFVFERIRTDRTKTALEYAVSFQTILAFHKIDRADVTAAVLSSVVAPVNATVIEAVDTVFGVKVTEISYRLDLGYDIDMPTPEAVGNDILCDAAGALLIRKAPIINFDMGTATVSSYINEAGNLRGVLICPGVRTSLNSLASKTASLPQIGLDPPGQAIGRNTLDAMRSGILYGTGGLIDGIIERIEEEIGLDCHVTATGGLAPYIAPYCAHEITQDPQLLLKGMIDIYRRNA